MPANSALALIAGSMAAFALAFFGGLPGLLIICTVLWLASGVAWIADGNL